MLYLQILVVILAVALWFYRGLSHGQFAPRFILPANLALTTSLILAAVVMFAGTVAGDVFLWLCLAIAMGFTLLNKAFEVFTPSEWQVLHTELIRREIPPNLLERNAPPRTVPGGVPSSPDTPPSDKYLALRERQRNAYLHIDDGSHPHFHHDNNSHYD